MSIRITELDAITSLQDGDYVAVDNESAGTHKFKALDISANVAKDIANTYSSSASYAIGQYCLYNNNLYRCTTTISTPEAWNAAHWVQVTVGEGLYDKVDKVSGKALSTNDFTNDYKAKLDGIQAGAEVNVQANWTQSDNTQDDYIKNKPGNATQSVSGFMSADDKAKLDSIASGAEVNVQADWAESDSSKDDYIKNKPTIDEALSLDSDNAVRNSVITAGINQVQNNLDTEITNRQNAVSAEQLDRENADNALDGRLDTVEETLPNKANIDGFYENMTVGNAEQLVSEKYTIDEEPYTYRKSGGYLAIGDREFDEIVGASVVENQLLRDLSTGVQTSGGTASYADGVVTFLANSKNQQAYKIGATITNHVYIAFATFQTTSATPDVHLRAFGANATAIATTADQTSFMIVKFAGSGTTSVGIQDGRSSGFDAIKIKALQLIDLTQMLGTTIADYIYSLEQATAGSGVAFYKKYFGDGYKAYDSGSLKSVEGLVSHDTVGLNQWDEEWELGGLTWSNGAPYSATDRIRSKNFSPCLPNTSYYGNKGWSIFFYDADKNFISYNGFLPQGGSMTTPVNCHYFKLVDLSDTTYDYSFCINLSGSRNGEYEPYVKHSYPLDSSVTLRGLYKLVDGKLKADGDVYKSDGSVERRYGIVDLGTLTWTYSSLNGGYFNAPIDDIKPLSAWTAKMNVICPKYLSVIGNGFINNETDKAVSGQVNYQLIRIRDSAYSDATAFTTAMSGVYLIYEKATPTTETAEPYQSPQIVSEYGTEEYVSTSVIPIGHYTKYMPNLRAKLEMAPESPDGDGDYIVRQTDGENVYVPLVIENVLPTIPSTAGSYVLTVTVVEGEDPVLSWEVQS